MKRKIIIYFNSTIAHCSQIFCGFELLKQDKDVHVEYQMDYASIPFNKLRVDYNGLKLIFDMADDYFIDPKLYDFSDFYIKRMLLKSDAENLPKALPCGLHYSVMVPNQYLRNVFFRKPSLISYSAKYSRLFSKFLKINDSIYNVNLKNMECPPKESENILFGTRLWDPQNNEVDWKKKERKTINQQRIAIIRTLRESYNEKFKGGVEKSELSNILCPDILISKTESRKCNYLKSLKNASIGISNFGLEGSIGWKFAEYLAHSLAVVTTPITQYQLHGDLEEGINYLSFENIEECISAVKKLVDDPFLRNSIQEENFNYYQKYLHPEKKMRIILGMIDKRV